MKHTDQINIYLEYARHINANEQVESWIEHTLANHLKRAKNPVPTEEIEHIIDFLSSVNAPKKIHLVSYEQANIKAEAWLVKLAQEASQIRERKNDTKTILDFGDGFKIVQLIGKRAFEREGKLMSHCVASYYNRDTKIYSLRDRFNRPHTTIEWGKQVKGKGNGDISPKYVDYIVQFMESQGMPMRESEMSRLGYRVAPFEGMIKNKLYKGRYLPKDELLIPEDGYAIVTNEEQFLTIKNKRSLKVVFDGSLDLRDTSITSLGNLQSVGGGLDLENTSITSLGNLQSVGGSLDLRDTSITSLGNLQSVGGGLDLRDTSITSLGNLQSVGDGLYLGGTSITSLGNLQSVGGGLDLENTSITSLSNLQSVGGSLDLRGTSITSLGNLQSVGGGLDLRDTQLAKTVLPDTLTIGGAVLR